MSETEEFRALSPVRSIREGSIERSSPIRHVEFNPGTPKSCSRQGTLEESALEDNLSRPGSPLLEKSAEPSGVANESKEQSQTEKIDSGRPEEARATEAPGVIGPRDPSRPGGDAPCPRNGSTAVGEWNSLPVLVERLRAALELSLANRRDEETPALPEDSGVDSEEDFRVRNSVERAILGSQEPEVKNDLKFLEDLLLSDIQTALSRLRETLERIDVTALAKHGAAADPSSKLHLLKLVSSLLSRLQVPEGASANKKASEMNPVPMPRKRRGTRHTIGVTTEELASARKWLEEERERQNLANSRKGSKVESSEALTARLEEFHHDKCTKDAINHRQSLRDRNKESPRDESREAQAQSPRVEPGPTTLHQYQPNVEGYQTKTNVIEADTTAQQNEENRVTKLAAVLRQRAEMAASSGRFSGNNKFSAKKSRIKRANTIDIPSYLKLQAESLGQDHAGCVSLRRPINVGDKVGFTTGNMMVPSFQPKTENDRKFLALINRNNEAPVNNQASSFKPFGYSKPSDMSSVVNENWNSRFSNIKTAFDKPSTVGGPEKVFLRNKSTKRFPPADQGSIGCNLMKDKGIYNGSPSMIKDSGFRHAPSSPFRKIEKPGLPLSPTKVPPAYHWSKNNVPTSTLKDKAKIMFDNVQTRGTQDAQEPSAFPRPPWIENERHDSKGTVTENGRLDYRSFCKQFAPFVGGETKLREEQRQVSQRRDSASSGKVVDGRISFRMLPNNSDTRREVPQFARDHHSSAWEGKSYGSKSGKGRDSKEINSYEATLRGSSSVAVQTGIDEDHHEEARSFRVVPKVTKGPPSVCSNACVQTGSDLTHPRQADDRRSRSYERRDRSTRPSQSLDQQRHFILDHNQNYHVIAERPNDSVVSSSQELSKLRSEPNFYAVPSSGKAPDYPRESQEKRSAKDQPKSFVPTIVTSENRPEGLAVNSSCEPKMDWPIDNPGFLDDENIQNQDISPEVGVITRYTCAIATVESMDSPEPRSEEAGPADSRTPSSPSPSQSWSRSRPPTNGTTTPEDEIRRHNLLQQSLVRRLQNEKTSLNESRAVSPNYSPSLTPNLVQDSFEPVRYQDYYQPSNFLEPGQHQPPKFLSPNVAKSQDYSPRVPSPTGMGSVNRIIALREAYEQPPVQPKPIQKERSPIPNGVNPIDSSDEYLVSCASKPSRSIVLSKSESWHQLAGSSSYPRAPKINVTSGSGQSPCQNLPKPPKPKSPSTQKLRSKQFEASSSSDSVRKMEEKIRRYFDGPSETLEVKETRSRRSSPRHLGKGLVGLTRSRTMPGLCDEKHRLTIPDVQLPLLNVNTADVDKVFDDLFEEVTKTDSHHC